MGKYIQEGREGNGDHIVQRVLVFSFVEEFHSGTWLLGWLT